MNTKDIEKLFEDELGIEEVCVYNYDETTKVLNMHFEIDFSPITKEGIYFTDFLVLTKKFALYKKIFDLVEDGLLNYRCIEIENNKLNIGTTNDEEKELEKILQEFFNEFLSIYKIL